MRPAATRATMHPDRMRSVDYWVGIPLCWILSVIARFPGARRPVVSPRRVLFIELAEMGSTVFACPAVRRLRERHPDCEVFFLVFSQIDEGIRALDLVPDDHVLTIDASSLGALVRDTWRFIRRARSLGIDTVVSLEMFARFSTMLSYMSGAATRVGFDGFAQDGLYIGELLTHRLIYNPHLHTWQSFVALVDAIDAPPGNLPMGKFAAAGPAAGVLPQRASDPADLAHMRGRLGLDKPDLADKRLIVINPNASKLLSIRKWPLDRYVSLVERLAADPAIVCVVTGSTAEVDDARAIVAHAGSDRVINMAGQTTLRELLDLFSLADVLVSNDSGPAQFAALTRVHVVVLFGPETPKLYKPLTDRCTVLYTDLACSPCVSAYNQRRTVCTDNQCLTQISVATVHDATMRAIDRASGGAMPLAK